MFPRGDVRHQHALLVEQPAHLGELALIGKIDEALEQPQLGEQGPVLELCQDAEQLEAMLVTDTHGYRHGHDPAEDRRPERHHEALVRLAEDDELVALPHSFRLQRAEQRERPVPQLAERERGLVGLAVNEADAAIEAARLVEELRQGAVQFHATPGVR